MKHAIFADNVFFFVIVSVISLRTPVPSLPLCVSPLSLIKITCLT